MAESRTSYSSSRRDTVRRFPWWLPAALTVPVAILYATGTEPAYGEALEALLAGVPLALVVTIASAFPAVLIGLLIGLGCRSEVTLFRNLAYFYLAVVGGVPTIVMIFLVAFVIAPALAQGLGLASGPFSMTARGIVALALAYSAIFGDVFRLGLLASRGRSGGGRPGPRLGPATAAAAGIVVMAMLRDSSLLSLLAVREITQQARLFAGSTFAFAEGYLVAVCLYLLLTIPLRFLTQWYEQRAMPTAATGLKGV
jgi:polar amino acid transport system permease protein